MADLSAAQQVILNIARAKLGNSPGLDDHYVLDPSHAEAFWQASYGVWYFQPCPAGLVFNPELNLCDYPQDVSPDLNPAPRLVW